MSGSEQVLRRLELTVRTKLDGLLQGNYQGLLPGPGSEAGESRPYTPGDDVRRMDWPVTARTTTAHVRETIADRELETWLVVDLSASLDFGTARTEKRELVLAALTALVHLTVRSGNRVGAVVGTGDQIFHIPAMPGRAHARYLLRRIAATPRAADVGGRGGEGSVAQMLSSLARPPRRRGLVAVVSDFIDSAVTDAAPAWERALAGLSQRHQLLAVEIVDPRELELAPAGLITFVDPETGGQLEVQTSSKEVRERYARAAAEQRARIATGLRHAGAAHLQLRTDHDWLADIVRFVITQRHLLAGAGGVRGGALRQAVR
jgi:uncharacterized protein (DUF58 family)